MLTSLRLRSFKCFDRLDLSLSSMTMLTGFNTAGKSSSVQPLLLLSQALKSGHLESTVSLDGPIVRLGTPGEVFPDRQSETVRRLSIGVGSGSIDGLWHFGTGRRDGGSSLPLESLELTGGANGGLKSRNWPNVASLPDEYRRLMEKIREVVFIGATRTGTLDAFPSVETASAVHADVGAQGEYAAWWFAENLDEDVAEARRHPDESAPSLRRQFNAWAAEIFPGAEANAQRIVRTSLQRLELRTSTTEEYRRPANIGYGLTYVFPILVACLLAREGQTIVVDSPEAHLHPRGQSAMGRILARFAASGVQIVVETHSDHLLNGMRRAVMSGLIERHDVGTFFFGLSQPDHLGPPVTTISMDANGSLDNWPEGFFDQAEIDLASLAGWDAE